MRQIASEATTVRFRRIEVEGDAVLDAVLDARRNAQAVTAYVLSPTLPTSPTRNPHARDASPAIVPGFRLPSAEAVGFKGERHNLRATSYRTKSLRATP